MKKLTYLLLAVILFSSHDMYLKLDNYFLTPNTAAKIQLFNGTFEQSDNVIDRNRMLDASLVGNGQRMPIDTNQWSDQGGMTLLDFQTGEAGTWVMGVSTRARNIEMDAEAFNRYLEHDGVLDMIAQREANNTLDSSAVEKYSKHVKTIFQVGEELTADWQTKLGYPIEFIPLANPYEMHPGHDLSVKLLWQDQPLKNQLVYVGSTKSEADHDGHSHTHADGTEHDHSHDHSHDHAEEADHSHDLAQYRTNDDGIVKIPITHQGTWYMRTIHLTTVDAPGLTHESNWATLTFAIGSGHTHGVVGAVSGLPTYVYILLGLALGVIGFLVFRKRS